MKVKIFKCFGAVMVAVLFSFSVCFAQEVSVSVNTSPTVSVKTRVSEKELQLKMDEFTKTLNEGLKDLSKNLTVTLNNIAPKIKLELKDLDIDRDIHLDLGDTESFSKGDEDNDDVNIESGTAKEKIKNYSKSYSLDGNDKIKLSNQYGKITVTTWDKREVKVDVQIRAEANDDDAAQKLLDGVQINDNKTGDLISFRTELERSNNSWSIFGRNKAHKLTINYTVYMPAKTDLNVEASYGSIELPNLSGHVKISSSYGSVSAENLSNPANEIEGSYGSLNVNSLNGAHLEFSYGSVNIEECNNLKADLSYGSFKLGKLKGSGDLNLSYVGGFKIDDLGNSFKKLNINSDYSGISVGAPANSNFEFDITTTYGGFNYDGNKVTITSKTPADGSRHTSLTKNYKGHYGKEGAEAQVNIHSTYGGVNIN